MKHAHLLPRFTSIVVMFFLLSFSSFYSFLSPSTIFAASCSSYEEVIAGNAWEDHGDIDDGGVLVMLPDDSELPEGYAAVGEDWEIALDNPDRFMPAGWWSLYRVCPTVDRTPEEVGAPDESCPTIEQAIDTHGWEGVGETGDGGVVVRLPDADALPFGYEAIGEDWQISLDNPDPTCPPDIGAYTV